MSVSNKIVYPKSQFTISKVTFDITSNTEVISAGGAGIKTYVVAIIFHNNDSTGSNDTPVRIQDGSGGTDLYGGSSGHIYVVGRGGLFGTPMSVAVPWFESSANTAIYLNPTSSKRIAGAIWYYQK